jgi:hypothetical protein
MTMPSRLTTLLLGAALLSGCAEKEPPARTVTEFVENPILLEAAMVRCSRDRRESRYEQECINAREAVNRIEAKEEADRRAELEARSESKRKALRRMQEAQAEARRRAEEAERLRREAEYLAQFGVLPPSDESGDEEELPAGNVPLAVVPESEANEQLSDTSGQSLAAGDGSNAPVMRTEPEEASQETPADLQDIREELRRRNEDDGGS